MSRCKYGKLKSPSKGRRCRRASRHSKARRSSRRSRRSHRKAYGLSALVMLAAVGGGVYLVAQNAKAPAQ